MASTLKLMTDADKVQFLTVPGCILHIRPVHFLIDQQLPELIVGNICRQLLRIIFCPHPSQTLRIFRWGRGRGRSCCRLSSATVATIATVVLTVSDLPSQPSQPSRGLFAFSIIGQRNTSPLVPDFVLIADAVFVQQPARLHIQILAQYVCRHANMDSIGKFRG